jgi:predicted NAD/FAD-dependent oxidoreductase
VARVLVLGAGIAGLVGAGVLERAGHDVVVLDKGRRPGGRMATRRPDGPDGPVFDHGAQFVTLRSDELAAETARWRDNGWLVEWFRGSPDHGADGGDGHPRFRGSPYQRGLPEALAGELRDVRCGVRVTALAHDHGWVATTADAGGVRADAVLSTAPVPQARELLAAGGVTLPRRLADELARVTYEPCIALLLAPDGPVDLPGSGVLRLPDHDVLDILTDNRAKGISPVPAVTVHATGAWSRRHWDAPDDDVVPALLAAVDDVLGATGTVRHVQRWRYSAPTSQHDDLAPGTTSPGPLRFAGDAFAGGRVEGAALSGWAAAHRLLATV